VGGRGALMDAQKDCIAARRTCAADKACLNKTYNDRIAVLEKEFARIASAARSDIHSHRTNRLTRAH
jgi:uncharacterized protein